MRLLSTALDSPVILDGLLCDVMFVRCRIQADQNFISACVKLGTDSSCGPPEYLHSVGTAWPSGRTKHQLEGAGLARLSCNSLRQYISAPLVPPPQMAQYTADTRPVQPEHGSPPAVSRNMMTSSTLRTSGHFMVSYIISDCISLLSSFYYQVRMNCF
jgi:hypothetical protein